MKTYELYIDGKWMKSDADRRIEVENPATREVIGDVPRGNEADVNRAVAAAKAAELS